MEDQEMQAKFIQWLQEKTGAKTEEELKQVLTKLSADKEQLAQVMQEFKTEVGGSQMPMQRNGGKAAYLECLSKFKKGGKVNCGCGGKMESGAKVPKAFLGAALGAVKGAGAILKGGTSLVKGAKTIAGVAKAASFANKAIGVGKQIMGGATIPNRPQATMTNSIGDTASLSVPNVNTQTLPTFTVGMVGNPNNVPGGRVVTPPQNTTPKLVEKGAKLRAKGVKK